MAKTKKSGPAADKYLEWVLRFPLKVIRDDAHLDRAAAVIDELTDRDDLDTGEQEYLDVLSTLIEQYEAENVPIPDATGAEVLRHLMEARDATQAEVARATGIAESTVSALLSGRRKLNPSHVGRLAKFFHVDPGVFAGGW